MQSIQDYYVAPGAVVTGDVTLSPGVNIWFACVVRGDLARITLGPRVNIQDGCIPWPMAGGSGATRWSALGLGC
jgi:carbonic anhydrase/acetyltransferase-like protein (isoleucine patch superfamily)